MAALSGDRINRRWYQNAGPASQKRPYASSNNFPASVTAYVGALMMGVDGVARPMLSGASLVALATLFDGSGANDGLYVRARAPHVKLALVDPAAMSAEESITIAYGATVDITVSLATSAMSAITSTPNTIAQSIRRHAEANRLLACDVKGTGADAIAAVASTAVAHIEVLGVCPERLETVISAAAMTLRPSVVFDIGKWGMLLSGDAPSVGAMVTLSNDNEITKAGDGFDLTAPLVAIEGGLYFVDLAQAR